MNNIRTTGKRYIFAFAIFIALLIADRYYWAEISQWREDQATNIWLGYIYGLKNIPVGLISSTKILNPNGAIVLGYFLSLLPNLLYVSFFLGVAQIAVLLWVGWSAFRGNWKYYLLAVIPPLTSVLLRSTAIEFWNQYLLTFINLLFLLFALRYLKKPSLWNIPPIVALICIAPSLYLAGIVNAIVMAILSLGLLIYKKPARDHLLAVLSVSALIIVVSIYITWLPYFSAVNIKSLTTYNANKTGIVSMVEDAGKALFEFPIYLASQWENPSKFASSFEFFDPRILSPGAQFLFQLAGKFYWLQAIFSFAVFCSFIIYSLIQKAKINDLKIKIDSSIGRMVVLSAAFIIASYTISAWLGGPSWIDDYRTDQTVQFVPLELFIIFLLPMLIITQGKIKKIISATTYVSMITFTVINLLCGFLIIRNHLTYRGYALTDADVPLIDKMQVMDFIARDWRRVSNSTIVPVDYKLGGGRWDAIPEVGLSLTQWYSAPMTDGRSFDYDLKRRYGLTNRQEGIQLRTFGTGRYLVTYAFEDKPNIPNANIKNYIFGRLRVSVVER